MQISSRDMQEFDSSALNKTELMIVFLSRKYLFLKISMTTGTRRTEMGFWHFWFSYLRAFLLHACIHYLANSIWIFPPFRRVFPEWVEGERLPSVWAKKLSSSSKFVSLGDRSPCQRCFWRIAKVIHESWDVIPSVSHILHFMSCFGMGEEVTRRPAWIWEIRIRGEGREAKEWSHLPGRQSRILKRVPFPDFSNKISFLLKTTFFVCKKSLSCVDNDTGC